MVSPFFERVVSSLEGTALGQFARTTINEHCKLIGRTPENLTKEDGGRLVMTLMANVAGLLPEGEWSLVDERLKGILTDEEPVRGKAKGFLFQCIFDYISLKRGILAFNEVKKKAEVPDKLRTEGWYPVAIMADLLEVAESILGQKGGSRCRMMGRYITSHEGFNLERFWLSEQKRKIEQAFSNIQEMLLFDNFSLKESKDKTGLELYCGELGNEYLKQFIMGMCEGVFKLRNIYPNSVELLNTGKDGFGIRLMYRNFEEGDNA